MRAAGCGSGRPGVWAIGRCVVLATLVLAVGPWLLTACAATDDAADPLDGTCWTLTAWSVSSVSASDVEITATFADGTVSGRSAVNTYSAPYTARTSDSTSSGTFTAGPVTSTEMAGSPDAMRAEGAYVTLLQQVDSFRLDGAGLTLADGAADQLIFEPCG